MARELAQYCVASRRILRLHSLSISPSSLSLNRSPSSSQYSAQFQSAFYSRSRYIAPRCCSHCNSSRRMTPSLQRVVALSNTRRRNDVEWLYPPLRRTLMLTASTRGVNVRLTSCLVAFMHSDSLKQPHNAQNHDPNPTTQRNIGAMASIRGPAATQQYN